MVSLKRCTLMPRFAPKRSIARTVSMTSLLWGQARRVWLPRCGRRNRGITAC